MLSNRALYSYKHICDDDDGQKLAWRVEADSGWLVFQTMEGEQMMRAEIGNTREGFLALVGNHRDRKRDMYEFTIVTLEQYDKHIRPRLEYKKEVPSFLNTRELHMFYQTFGYNAL